MNQHQERRGKFSKTFYDGILDNSHMKVVDDIYKKKQFQGLSGKDAKEFYEKLKNEKDDMAKKANRLLQDYKKKLSELL